MPKFRHKTLACLSPVTESIDTRRCEQNCFNEEETMPLEEVRSCWEFPTEYFQGVTMTEMCFGHLWIGFRHIWISSEYDSDLMTHWLLVMSGFRIHTLHGWLRSGGTLTGSWLGLVPPVTVSAHSLISFSLPEVDFSWRTKGWSCHHFLPPPTQPAMTPSLYLINSLLWLHLTSLLFHSKCCLLYACLFRKKLYLFKDFFMLTWVFFHNITIQHFIIALKI